MPVDMVDAHGAPVSITTVTMADGSKAPAHVLIPLAADFSAFPDEVVPAGGGLVHSIAANANRSGGYVQAGAGNNGKITVTLTKAGGGTLVAVLRRNQDFKLSIFPGRVLQQAFTVVGDTAGDTVTTVEYL